MNNGCIPDCRFLPLSPEGEFSALKLILSASGGMGLLRVEACDNLKRIMNNSILLVGIGGAGGSILRYLLQRSFNISSFPYSTLAINISGCLLIGILWGLFSKNNLAEAAAILLMTGFCGGFTIFSAFTYEGIQLLMENKWLLFFAYAMTSVAGGLIATYLGFKIFS